MKRTLLLLKQMAVLYITESCVKMVDLVYILGDMSCLSFETNIFLHYSDKIVLQGMIVKFDHVKLGIAIAYIQYTTMLLAILFADKVNLICNDDRLI